ncbi:MAG: phage regulatory CII family protein [Sphingomonadales bacterium]
MGLLTDTEIAAIKAATRRQIRASGGLESAVLGGVSVSATQLSRYQNIYHAETMPARIIGQLMRESGDLSVLECLAGLANCVLLRVSVEDGDGLHRDMSRISETLGRTFADYARANEDGYINSDEAARLMSDIDSLVSVCMHAMSILKTIANGGADDIPS